MVNDHFVIRVIAILVIINSCLTFVQVESVNRHHAKRVRNNKHIITYTEEPMLVVPITEDDKQSTAFIQLTSNSTCKEGFKCPIEQAECCEGGELCCLYGCDNGAEPIRCKANEYVGSMHAAKAKLEVEISEDQKKEIWKQERRQKRGSGPAEFARKQAKEEQSKKQAVKNEAAVKQYAKVQEEKKKARQTKNTDKERMKEETHKKEEAMKRSQRELPLAKGFRPYDKGYRHPKFSRVSGICLISGMLIGAQTNQLIAVLPTICRPAERLVFDVHLSRAQTARYDVLSNGEIRYVGGAVRSGGNLGHWVPLDGMSFVISDVPQQRVPLRPPWVDYGRAGYQGARYNASLDGLCSLSGLIRTKDWRVSSMTNPIFVMDSDCRPDKRLVFSLNHHEFSFRVDVLPSGEGHYVAGNKFHPWISLSGLIFFNSCTDKLTLSSGWRPFSDSYRTPCYVIHRTMCVLSGMARAQEWSADIGEVPAFCRPAQRLIFNVNADDNSQRIDILPSGQIQWVDGKKSWISFDGIRYVVP